MDWEWKELASATHVSVWPICEQKKRYVSATRSCEKMRSAGTDAVARASDVRLVQQQSNVRLVQ